MKTHWFALLLLGFCVAARADRDIVYSARYYAPPGSHHTSHFHIYRINPDGTGRMQLTFGTLGDYDYAPKWSADGRQVTYIERSSTSVFDKLCEIDASGGNRRVLKTLDFDRNRERLFASGYHLQNDEGDYGKVPDRHILINLKTGRRLTLPVPAHDDPNDELLPMPGAKLVYAVSNHNSTVGIDYLFYRLNPDTGALHYLTEGKFLAWSPDGSRFCVAPGRDTTPYEKRPSPYAADPDATAQERLGEAYRLVWSAPLYVRAAAGGPMKQITPRLSYVTGADWRKGT